MKSLPKFCHLVSGAGEAVTELEAFDVSLLAAGVGDFNLIRVSSIFPPFCHIVTQIHKRSKRLQAPNNDLPVNAQEHTCLISPGSLVATAFAFITSEVCTEPLAASVAVGVPEDTSLPGVIMEWHGRGTKKMAEESVVAMVSRAMERRGRKIKDIPVVAAEWVVTEGHAGAAFAAALLF